MLAAPATPMQAQKRQMAVHHSLRGAWYELSQWSAGCPSMPSLVTNGRLSIGRFFSCIKHQAEFWHPFFTSHEGVDFKAPRLFIFATVFGAVFQRIPHANSLHGAAPHDNANAPGGLLLSNFVRCPTIATSILLSGTVWYFYGSTVFLLRSVSAPMIL